MPNVHRQIVMEYSYVYAAVSPLDGTLDSLILPDVDADSMSLFLSEVSERHPDEMILMFMDQAGWHKAKRLVVPDNIKLLNLPPYSPELQKALFMPALVSIQCNPVVQIMYHRLKENGKNGKVIVCAVMRKLVHLIFGILKSGRPFDPNYRQLCA